MPWGSWGGTLPGGYLAEGGYPSPGGYPAGGVPWPGGVPCRGGTCRGYPGWGGVPWGGTQLGQHREYLLHGGRYASCVHAGGLSCCLYFQKLCKNLTSYFLGCEDIVADQISVENLVMILNWSSEPHGSSWVHRQALHFLKEEFLNVMHSPVLFDLSKQYLIQAIRSDFLQVSVQANCTTTFSVREEKCTVFVKIKIKQTALL